MNRIYNRRDFEESARAYINAIKPTPQLTANLSASFAQMLADDLDGPVSVVLMGFRVVREPKPQAGRPARVA